MSTFTHSEYWGFIAKFFFSVFVLGYVVFMGLTHFFNREKQYSNSLLFLLSLGLAPGLIALFLYYVLLLLPSQASLTYVLLVTLPFGLLFGISIKQIGVYKNLFAEIQNWVKKQFPNVLSKLAFGASILFILMCVAYFNYYLFSKTITEHDTLEYAVQGKVFYQDNNIPYDTYRYDEKSGFYYVGLHGFTFPMQTTWEKHLNAITGFSKDIYFRSINMLFGTLTALLLLLLLARQALFLGLVGALTLFTCYGFFETYFKYHIDNMRIFYLIVALLLFVQAIRIPTLRNFIFFGIVLGLQVNSHSLGALICFIQLAVLFVFVPGNFMHKVKLCATAAITMLAFGGIHYCIDVLTGTGWLFQQVKFY